MDLHLARVPAPHPDLPPRFAWPKNGKTPLAFVAQYDLDELAAFDLEGKLPKRGVISVFAQLVPLDGYGEHVQVFHLPSAKALVRTSPPHPAAADDRPGKVARATPRQILVLPSPDHRAAGALRLNGDERTRYHDDVWLKLRLDGHQLLGWADAPFDRGWELLSLIASDRKFGFALGDVQTLRLHVSAARLAKADFRVVRATMDAD